MVVPVRLPKNYVAAIDQIVKSGWAATRSEVIRRLIDYMLTHMPAAYDEWEPPAPVGS